MPINDGSYTSTTTSTTTTFNYLSGCAPLTGTSTNAWDISAQCLRHATGQLTEYADGTAETNCEYCGAVILVHAVPGGINLLRIQQLLEKLVADECSDELVEEYVEMRQVLQAEQDALELAVAMMQPIDLLLAQRLLS